MMRMMDQDDDVGPVNIGNPVENTMLELAQAVLAVTGSKSELKHRPLPKDDPRAALPGHHQGQATAELGAEGAAGHRTGEHRRLLSPHAVR